jgi:hypothetical protein
MHTALLNRLFVAPFWRLWYWLPRLPVSVPEYDAYAERERMRSIAPQCEGAEAIYREPPLFVHVRVQRIEQTYQEVSVTVVGLDTPGFPKLERPLNVGSSWGPHLTFSATRWHVMYANWSLYFDPRVIQATIAAAQTEPCGTLGWQVRVMDALYRKPDAV